MPTDRSANTMSIGSLMIRGAREAVAHKRGMLPDVRTTSAKVTVRSVDVVPPPKYGELDIQDIRRRLGVSQTVFAHLLGASPATVRAWERGAREPSDMARRLLELLERRPEAFAEVLVVQ
jgi:DNA-binding transcriptional regulator YiaG